MRRWILYTSSRLGQGLVALIGLVLATFILVRMTGSPVTMMLPLHATEGERAALASQLALDQPLWAQFVAYGDQVTHGDFGESFAFQHGQPALAVVLERMPATIELALGALVIGVLLGVPTAVVATVWRHTWVRRACEYFALIGQSVAVFWLALVLMRIFSIELGLLPVAGRSGFESYVLPCVSLGWYVSAGIFRILRSGLTEALDREHVVFLRAKGLPLVSNVVLKHGLRSATVPVLAFTTTIAGALLSGSVVIETVFAWPGVGFASVQALTMRDFPVVQAAVFVFGLITILLNLFADLMYAVLDPRIRHGVRP